MGIKYFLAILSISVLPWGISSTEAPPLATTEAPRVANCEGKIVTARDGTDQEYVECKNIGIDGRSLDDVLLQSKYNISGMSTFNALVSRIKGLHINRPKGDITAGAAFSALTNLKIFDVEFGGNNRLSLPRDGFKNKPGLTKIFIHGVKFSENTVLALDDLKHQLNSFSIKGCSPAIKILKEIAKFTNLTSRLQFAWCEGEEFPEDTFHKSASTIESFKIAACNVKKITKNVFKDMKNLSGFRWEYSNITEIEPGAFDELVNLTYLSMSDNQIKHLPAGLFDNNKKLENVDFQNNNGIENLSRENFTHCANFRDLRI